METFILFFDLVAVTVLLTNLASLAFATYMNWRAGHPLYELSGSAYVYGAAALLWLAASSGVLS